MLVLAEPDLDAMSIDDYVVRSAPTTLLVLPKRRGATDPQRTDWVGSVELLTLDRIGALLNPFVSKAEVVRISRPTKWTINRLGSVPGRFREIEAASAHLLDGAVNDHALQDEVQQHPQHGRNTRYDSSASGALKPRDEESHDRDCRDHEKAPEATLQHIEGLAECKPDREIRAALGAAGYGEFIAPASLLPVTRHREAITCLRSRPRANKGFVIPAAAWLCAGLDLRELPAHDRCRPKEGEQDHGAASRAHR